MSVHHLAVNITCHAWNKNRDRLALCPGNNEVHIYGWNGSTWTKEDELREHDQLVTSIDWAPNTNRLLTCSEDRNAYVWVLDAKTEEWKPTLVILRLTRAAYMAQWSPKEDKFAVSSGAKVVAICSLDVENDFWVSKHIKKHRSTVLSCEWHPKNVLILTGSSDYKVRIFSAWVKDVDAKPGPTLGFGEKLPFGEMLMELDVAGGWVHSARWNPSGNEICFVGHDSSISFADVSTPTPKPQKIKHNGLPFMCLMWITDSIVVAAGHECAPIVFKKSGSEWKLADNMDKGGAAGGGVVSPRAGAAAPAPAGNNAFNVFQGKVDRNEEGGRGDTVLPTKHQNCITAIVNFNANQFTTSGVDGKLVFWNKPK